MKDSHRREAVCLRPVRLALHSETHADISQAAAHRYDDITSSSETLREFMILFGVCGFVYSCCDDDADVVADLCSPDAQTISVLKSHFTLITSL